MMWSSSKNEQNPANNLQNINGKPFIFIHINKTGGISWGERLNLPFKMHFTATEVIHAIGWKNWKSALSFSIVRNPFDKVVSHYFYRVQTNQTDMGSGIVDFSTWVKKCYGKNKDPFFYDQPKMFQTQMDWINVDGRPAVDLILRFENMEKEYQKVAQHLGIDQDLPHKNRTKREHFKNYFTKETWNIVAEWFQKDIEYLGYETSY